MPAALPILIISFGGAWAWLEQDSVRTLSLGLLCKDLVSSPNDMHGRAPRCSSTASRTFDQIRSETA